MLPIKAGCKRLPDVILKGTSGFERLKARPELTVEHLIASGDWDDFSHPMKAAARAKLEKIRKQPTAENSIALTGD